MMDETAEAAGPLLARALGELCQGFGGDLVALAQRNRSISTIHLLDPPRDLTLVVAHHQLGLTAHDERIHRIDDFQRLRAVVDHVA